MSKDWSILSAFQHIYNYMLLKIVVVKENKYVSEYRQNRVCHMDFTQLLE